MDSRHLICLVWVVSARCIKAYLIGTKKVFAVKVLNLLHPGAAKSFKAECEVLRNVKHRNLVKLVTVCSSVDHQGNDFKALVYEFMSNRNLHDWLYPMFITNEAHESPRNLKFHQRLSIVIDVANALEYLHHGYESPVIHCDLKPSNVLLDGEMVGNMADFGLARFFPETTIIYPVNQSSTIGVRGSIGYIASGIALAYFSIRSIFGH